METLVKIQSLDNYFSNKLQQVKTKMCTTPGPRIMRFFGLVKVNLALSEYTLNAK